MSIFASRVPAEPVPHTELRDERPPESPDHAVMIDDGEGTHELNQAHLREPHAVADVVPGDALSEHDALALQFEQEQRDRSTFPVTDQRVAAPVDDEYLMADQHAVELQLQEIAAHVCGSRGPLGGPTLAPAGPGRRRRAALRTTPQIDENARGEADRVAQ